MVSVALQFGIPGAVELVVVLLVMALMAVPLVAVVLAVVYLSRRKSRTDERIEELEREVANLRDERGTAAEPDDRLE